MTDLKIGCVCGQKNFFKIAKTLYDAKMSFAVGGLNLFDKFKNRLGLSVLIVDMLAPDLRKRQRLDERVDLAGVRIIALSKNGTNIKAINDVIGRNPDAVIDMASLEKFLPACVRQLS